jgi:predicted DNA binding CopG/RHH family protein
MIKQVKKSKNWIGYYEDENILEELTDEQVDFDLNDRLRQDVLSGRRKRKLKNITIKIDPLHIMTIKKLATMKSIPYQTLIRQWLAEDIKQELDLSVK